MLTVAAVLECPLAHILHSPPLLSQSASSHPFCRLFFSSSFPASLSPCAPFITKDPSRSPKPSSFLDLRIYTTSQRKGCRKEEQERPFKSGRHNNVRNAFLLQANSRPPDQYFPLLHAAFKSPWSFARTESRSSRKPRDPYCSEQMAGLRCFVFTPAHCSAIRCHHEASTMCRIAVDLRSGRRSNQSLTDDVSAAFTNLPSQPSPDRTRTEEKSSCPHQLRDIFKGRGDGGNSKYSPPGNPAQ